jgi:hypothetical protein
MTRDTLNIVNMCSNIQTNISQQLKEKLNKENDAYVLAQWQNEIWWTRIKLKVTNSSIKASILGAE